jgi:hypothetical protein
MGALTFSPAVLGALGALRPLPPPKPPEATTLTTQDLAQDLFQRALQSAAQLPVVQPVTGGSTLAQEVTASLLAALTAPQAAADSSAVPTATTNPAAIQATGSTPAPTADSTTPTVTPPAATDFPLVQDAAAFSATSDFAFGTALRFGAGVAALAGPAVVATDFGSGLLRDATGVLRTGPLEPRASNPGQEAFARPQSQRALLGYATTTAPETAGTVDLFA